MPESFQMNLEGHFIKELRVEADFYGLSDKMFSPISPVFKFGQLAGP